MGISYGYASSNYTVYVLLGLFMLNTMRGYKRRFVWTLSENSEIMK